MKRLGLVLLATLTTAGFAHAVVVGSSANAASGITLEGANFADAARLPAKKSAASNAPSTTPLPPALRSALSKSMTRDAQTAAPHIDDGISTLRPRVWEEQKVVASDGGVAHSFGNAVAISGNTALIGAPTSNNAASGDGAVYVFTESNGVWSEQQKLLASDGAADDLFGTSIAMHGNMAIVGAWGGLYGGFGIGDTPMRGAIDPANAIASAGDAGAAYVFTESNGVWTQTAKLVAEGPSAGEYFAQTVAISDTTAMVGAYRATVDPGNPEQGAVYVFTRSGDTWTQTQKLVANDGQTDDNFGWGIALAGNQALIGAFGATLYRNAMGQGAVYAFEQVDGQWMQTQKLSADDGERADYFGQSVALSGTTALIGTMSGGTHGGLGNGAAYVFNYANGLWSERQKLIAQNGDPLDAFGISVALSGSTALVGAYYARVGFNTQQGAAFVFTESDGRWIQTKRLTAGDGGVHDKMAFSVALDGTTAMMGAQTLKIDGNIIQGAAYIYSSHATAAASVAPTALSFHLSPGEEGSATVNLDNHGGEPLDYTIDEASRNRRRIGLNQSSGARSVEPTIYPQSPMAPIAVSTIAGPQAPAPWSRQGGDLSFAWDDGNYEEIWTLSQGSNEGAGIWLNRFSPPLGTGSFSVDSISIMWPQNPYGTLVGRQVNLLAYYDADVDGDPRNALRLGGDHVVTIDDLDRFIDYVVDFRVPGDGDVYIGFESTYARGGSWPKLHPAALDTSSPAQGRSWLAGNVDGDPDVNRLDSHNFIGFLESFPAAGNWLIRATGADADNDCVAPGEVPWLSVTPASGSVAVGATQVVTVTADAGGLAPGQYPAMLCVGSNDPLNRLLRIPVNLSVGPDDAIFQDGFDGRP